MLSFSVIVPALDEAGHIEETLLSARRALGAGTELIVVDGGSRDGTARLAARRARVVLTAPGRGHQLSRGAAAASGDVLLFLHADTRLSEDAGAHIRTCLQDPDVVGGCCRFAVHPPARRLSPFRLLEAGVNLRTRLFRSATGDQAIFARRDAYRAAGGFSDLPLFEDVTFVARLRRQGRFQPVDAVARTSRRRWDRDGFWRTVLLHWLLRAAFRFGASPERLGQVYGPGRGGRRPARRDGLEPSLANEGAEPPVNASCP